VLLLLLALSLLSVLPNRLRNPFAALRAFGWYVRRSRNYWFVRARLLVDLLAGVLVTGAACLGFPCWLCSGVTVALLDKLRLFSARLLIAFVVLAVGVVVAGAAATAPDFFRSLACLVLVCWPLLSW
jgi:hypothetical protein